jgi:[acyl-carrier-protein] S-malonyltransferase
MMKKTVFLFPGVGSQHVGMGKYFYDHFNIFRETLEEANDILGMNLPEMCFSTAKKEELAKLENSQLALLAVSIATYRVYMQEIGIPPHYSIGHSLGEYSALCSAGVIKFPDALKLVRERAAIVNDAASGLNGTMAWVINLDSKIVEKVCREAFEKGRQVYISAFDSPHQTSISGRTDALMTMARELEKQGAIVYPLKLSGPFHCPLMKGASDKMREVLRLYSYENPNCSVIANRNARPYDGAGSVVENLALQLIEPIRWGDSIRYLVKQGTQMALEVGSKKVLKFLTEKNTDAVRAFTLDNEQDLASIGDELSVRKKRERVVLQF